MPSLIVGIVAAVIILIIIVAVATIFLLVARKKKAQKNAQKRVALAKKPRKMESANINATKFTHGGALVLDPKLRGPVVHACSSQEKISIHSIQFDPHLNEIVDIGSDVEIMKENADTTTLGTEVGTKVGKTILSIRRAIDRRKPVAAKTPGGMAAKTPGGGASPMSPQGAPQGTPQGTANRTPGKLTSKRHALKQAAPKRKRATPQNE
ncbi:hypothetical protein Y032_0618g711 [Ancylostoma ceylanicum]|uniref:Uncharacterized protein n=1 Tax=Ancylostoma ceylanicum TaxID=53326 RepID=A0A016WL34_9BILA|nr:hypothetical protein Y032_0618g711 [Ancylostoma ceylanicum]